MSAPLGASNAYFWTIAQGEEIKQKRAKFPADAWPKSAGGFKQSFQVGVSLSVDRSRVPLPGEPDDFDWFAAASFTSLPSGTSIKFTHKVYYEGGPAPVHVGYFLDDTASSLPSLKWYINSTVPLPSGGSMLNPSFVIRYAYAGSKLSTTLGAGYAGVVTPMKAEKDVFG
jgi:hypothetical protein